MVDDSKLEGMMAELRNQLNNVLKARADDRSWIEFYKKRAERAEGVITSASELSFHPDKVGEWYNNYNEKALKEANIEGFLKAEIQVMRAKALIWALQEDNVSIDTVKKVIIILEERFPGTKPR